MSNYAKKRKYICEKCCFNSNNKFDYDRHITTPKHKNMAVDDEILCKKTQKTQLDKTNICNCGKEYKHYSSLWNHKKKCNMQNILLEKEKEKEPANSIVDISFNQINNQTNNTEIIVELLKQNIEFKSLIAEQNKCMAEQNKNMLVLMEKGIGNITTNTNNNVTNNKFNLNFFLNEQCKDAMNITDFVNSLQLQLADLEKVGEVGYAQGISNIFINGLKQLDIFKRPIHCSDVKRETMYVKDKDAWEKENQEKEKMLWAIKHIAHKNVKQISEWQQENPGCKDGESEVNGKFLKIVCESMGGHNDTEDNANYNKIIRNVAMEVTIDRV